MIAKVCTFLAVVAVAHAGGLVGVGAPLLGGGHLGLVSSQSTAINHVAPVGAVGIAGPLGLGHGLGVGAYGLGIGASPLAVGHGIGAAPLAVGHGLIGGNLRANGLVGNGILGSNYGSVIGHTAAIGHGAFGGIRGGVLGHGGVVGLGHGGVLGLGHGLGHGKVIL